MQTASTTTQAGQIAANADQIAANKDLIGNNLSNIAVNLTAITVNRDSIVANASNIITNNTYIANVETNLGDLITGIGSLPAGYIFVGNNEGVTEAVLVQGDATIDSRGVTITDDAITAEKIAVNAVTTTKIADANITNDKLDKSNIPLSGFEAASADVALGGNKLTGVADPTLVQDTTTKKYVDDSLGSISSAGLISVTQGEEPNSNTGFRRSDANPDNYGAIGSYAIDLSISDPSPVTTYGATGDYATAMGKFTTASGRFSTALGRYTTASDYESLVNGQYNRAGSTVTSVAGSFKKENTAFVIGNGTGNGGTPLSDAFKVLFNGNTTVAGTLTIGDFTKPKTDGTSGQVLSTDGAGTVAWTSGAPGGLIGINEEGNTGYRRADAIADNYGVIGEGAVDLSFSEVDSDEFGATGDYATALGLETEAGGNFSMAFGENTKTKGNNSLAGGFDTYARDNTSFTFGNGIVANSYNEFVIGAFNEPADFSGGSWEETDPLFTIGNGTDGDTTTPFKF